MNKLCLNETNPARRSLDFCERITRKYTEFGEYGYAGVSLTFREEGKRLPGKQIKNTYQSLLFFYNRRDYWLDSRIMAGSIRRLYGRVHKEYIREQVLSVLKNFYQGWTDTRFLQQREMRQAAGTLAKHYGQLLERPETNTREGSPEPRDRIPQMAASLEKRVFLRSETKNVRMEEYRAQLQKSVTELLQKAESIRYEGYVSSAGLHPDQAVSKDREEISRTEKLYHREQREETEKFRFEEELYHREQREETEKFRSEEELYHREQDERIEELRRQEELSRREQRENSEELHRQEELLHRETRELAKEFKYSETLQREEAFRRAEESLKTVTHRNTLLSLRQGEEPVRTLGDPYHTKDIPDTKERARAKDEIKSFGEFRRLTEEERLELITALEQISFTDRDSTEVHRDFAYLQSTRSSGGRELMGYSLRFRKTEKWLFRFSDLKKYMVPAGKQESRHDREPAPGHAENLVYIQNMLENASLFYSPRLYRKLYREQSLSDSLSLVQNKILKSVRKAYRFVWKTYRNQNQNRSRVLNKNQNFSQSQTLYENNYEAYRQSWVQNQSLSYGPRIYQRMYQEKNQNVSLSLIQNKILQFVRKAYRNQNQNSSQILIENGNLSDSRILYENKAEFYSQSQVQNQSLSYGPRIYQRLYQEKNQGVSLSLIQNKILQFVRKTYRNQNQKRSRGLYKNQNYSYSQALYENNYEAYGQSRVQNQSLSYSPKFYRRLYQEKNQDGSLNLIQNKILQFVWRAYRNQNQNSSQILIENENLSDSRILYENKAEFYSQSQAQNQSLSYSPKLYQRLYQEKNQSSSLSLMQNRTELSGRKVYQEQNQYLLYSPSLFENLHLHSQKAIERAFKLHRQSIQTRYQAIQLPRKGAVYRFADPIRAGSRIFLRDIRERPVNAYTFDTAPLQGRQVWEQAGRMELRKTAPAKQEQESLEKQDEVLTARTVMLQKETVSVKKIMEEQKRQIISMQDEVRRQNKEIQDLTVKMKQTMQEASVSITQVANQVMQKMDKEFRLEKARRGM